MNIRLKFEILTFSAAPETHFESIPMLGGANSTFVGYTTLVLNPSNKENNCHFNYTPCSICWCPLSNMMDCMENTIKINIRV